MKRPFIFRSAGRDTSPIWLVIFSDMSTNLMLFFLMLFAMTRMTASERQMLAEGMEKATGHKKALDERLEKKRKESAAIQYLEDTVVHGKLKQYAKMDIDERWVKLTLELPVFFPIGSAEINPDAKDSLESLIAPLKDFQGDIVIEGHTDNVPIMGSGRYPSNWELSVARAVSVIDFFSGKGLNTKQLVAGGYGEYHPLYPNDTTEHKSKNRRIEITIIRQPRE